MRTQATFFSLEYGSATRTVDIRDITRLRMGEGPYTRIEFDNGGHIFVYGRIELVSWHVQQIAQRLHIPLKIPLQQPLITPRLNWR